MFIFRDGLEWWKYRQILNKILFKDISHNIMKSYNIVIKDLLTEWESYNGQVIPNLIEDLYKISISCKILVRYIILYAICK